VRSFNARSRLRQAKARQKEDAPSNHVAEGAAAADNER
jgi:hypothetical protein